MRLIQRCGLKELKEAYFAWRLTNWCNYKCSYCPNLRIITDDYRVDDHASYHKLVLARLKAVELPFTMCLTGGEPTLYPKIYEVVEGLAGIDNCMNAVLMTNLSRSLNFYKQFNDIQSDKVVIMASAHPEYVDASKFVEKSIELSSLSHIRYTAHINLMSDPSTWESTKQLIDTLNNNGVVVKPNVLSDTLDAQQNYTDEFYQIFEPYLNNTVDELINEVDCTFDDGTTERLLDYDIERRGLNRFKGYTCTPAAFKIDMGGEIRNTCTNRIIPLSLASKNLFKQETCPNETCGRMLLTYPKYNEV